MDSDPPRPYVCSAGHVRLFHGGWSGGRAYAPACVARRSPAGDRLCGRDMLEVRLSPEEVAALAAARDLGGEAAVRVLVFEFALRLLGSLR